ncbi:MAG: response regulator transcription factor [Bacteroidales bacterium]|nr:response regulator transcription factor [Bacteroidales bacterium]MCB8998969.1 response regulator transcription factor [Bacteroidales bacterium]MCB9013744.1 response regulator transcription factor [Bacteroidales bacterium]
MDYSKFKILLVDDEDDILEFLGYNLEKEGFIIHTARNGKEAIEIAEKIIPNLILMDVMMPKMDGIEACEQIRKNPRLKNVLIAFLTARGEEYSQIAGFDAGGDDYITKPIKPKLLVSRVKALLKRYSADNSSQQEETMPGEDLIIDKERYLVILKGEKLVLPKKEFELLNLLYSRPEKVFTREDIFSQVWGDNIIVGDRTIDVHIRKLREKLGDNYIRTIKGVGYKFTY